MNRISSLFDRTLFEYYEEGCTGCGYEVRSPDNCPIPGCSVFCSFISEEASERIREVVLERIDMYDIFGSDDLSLNEKLDEIFDETAWTTNYFQDNTIRKQTKLDTVPRVGDTVLIRNPQRVIRCGYPKHPKGVAKELLKNHGQEVFQFLSSIGVFRDSKKPKPLTTDMIVDMVAEEKALQDLFVKLGYLEISRNGFGGNQRTLHKKPINVAYTGTKATIVASRHVMTGTYFSPTGGYDSYNGEYYHETGGLDKMTRKNLICVAGHLSDKLLPDSLRPLICWMDVDDVEKIIPKQFDDIEE